MVSTRRLFIGTALTGAVPLALNLRVPAQAGAAPRDHVFDHIGRELARAIKLSKEAGAVRGEQVRHVASTLRLFEAHAAAVGLSSSTDRRLGRIIADRGVGAVVVEGLTDERVREIRAEIARAGIIVSAEELAKPTVLADAGALERAVARVHERGVTREIAGVAAVLDRLAASADLNGVAPGVLLARNRAQWNSEACRDLWWNMYILEASAIAVGAVAPIAAAQLLLALIFLQYYYSLMGC